MRDYEFKDGMVVKVGDGFVTGASKDFREQFDTDTLILKGDFKVKPQVNNAGYAEVTANGTGIYCEVKKRDEYGDITEVECTPL